ncbi:uncharacterized protein YciI [Amycolatopsis bartoniae]|uniref:YCII-related domain-containing protein n=1 Tax=Amycolatopsis bartoniae TaxID=941986 RepID=A0A8H9MCR1_9PSEU|nr:YciI family protein [Amycolatopsis bartoniae]MBB2934595.1 uncharacterized protein YciI [Amycolatopsis bartoniae]TVT06922.1 hypothetical protein FNH07_18440 [Amycolatopsis bartoniae]GHF46219.1 hypothetical protein GCM10017566_19130 [Amycolatopsis bartoniae]
MFVVLLTYTAPLEEVDYALPDYAKWLEKHFAAGEFLAAGRRDSREGCVILTRSMSRAKLEAILCVNPFVLGHLATFEIIEFAATRTAPELHRLNEAMAQLA